MTVINNAKTLETLHEYIDMGQKIIAVEQAGNCTDERSKVLIEKIKEVKHYLDLAESSKFPAYIKNGVRINKLSFIEEIQLKVNEFLDPETFYYVDTLELKDNFNILNNAQEDCQQLVQEICRAYKRFYEKDQLSDKPANIFDSIQQEMFQPLRPLLEKLREGIATASTNPAFEKSANLQELLTSLRETTDQTSQAIIYCDKIKEDVITHMESLLPHIKTEVLGVYNADEPPRAGLKLR